MARTIVTTKTITSINRVHTIRPVKLTLYHEKKGLNQLFAIMWARISAFEKLTQFLKTRWSRWTSGLVFEPPDQHIADSNLGMARWSPPYIDHPIYIRRSTEKSVFCKQWILRLKQPESRSIWRIRLKKKAKSKRDLDFKPMQQNCRKLFMSTLPQSTCKSSLQICALWQWWSYSTASAHQYHEAPTSDILNSSW